MQTENDTSKPEYSPEQMTGEGCQERLVRPLPFQRMSDELKVWPASQFKPHDMVLDKAQGEKLKILAVENETCHNALKNLSACCYGQNLTQSVAGAVELIRAFRESDKRLRDALEAIRIGIENEEENGLWDAENILAIIHETFAKPSNSMPNRKALAPATGRGNLKHRPEIKP